jgi:hypothetical protein
MNGAVISHTARGSVLALEFEHTRAKSYPADSALRQTLERLLKESSIQSSAMADCSLDEIRAIIDQGCIVAVLAQHLFNTFSTPPKLPKKPSSSEDAPKPRERAQTHVSSRSKYRQVLSDVIGTVEPGHDWRAEFVPLITEGSELQKKFDKKNHESLEAYQKSKQGSIDDAVAHAGYTKEVVSANVLRFFLRAPLSLMIHPPVLTGKQRCNPIFLSSDQRYYESDGRQRAAPRSDATWAANALDARSTSLCRHHHTPLRHSSKEGKRRESSAFGLPPSKGPSKRIG